MKTISIEIKDDLISFYGKAQIKKMILDELNYMRFKILEGKINKSMKEAKVDWDNTFEKSRATAFEEYASKRKLNGK